MLSPVGNDESAARKAALFLFFYLNGNVLQRCVAMALKEKTVK